jgi:putative ABC transport system ATP-binding protein
MSDQPQIHLRGVVKTFDDGRMRALDGVDVDIDAGEFVAIVGPSGCGKSTLLNMIAALDRPDEGSIEVAGHDLRDRRDLDHYRREDIGLVFQLDNLIPTLTAAENVEVPMFGRVTSRRDRRRHAVALLERVGLADRAHERPPQLSGGERQRIAIARALANEPPIVLADEPTGRLDSTTSAQIMDLLEALRRDRGVTLVVVTHDPRVSARADRLLQMLDGKVAAPARPTIGPAAGVASGSAHGDNAATTSAVSG